MTIQLAVLGAVLPQEESESASKRFVMAFLTFCALGVGAFGLVLFSLDKIGMLPPPPFTSNVCIDEKFKFLSERRLDDVDLLAVGSSVTWRNLNLAVVEQSGLAIHPLNAAPCYLHVSETAYYTDFLLQRLPNVKTVLSIVAPRDFEKCVSPKDTFFSRNLAEAYVFEGLPPFPIYLSHFKPLDFARDILNIKPLRTDSLHKFSIVMDQYGSAPLHVGSGWLPEPQLSESCFGALSELENVVTAHGAQLVVAAFPLQRQWVQKYDVDGKVMEDFETRIRSALRKPSSQFISSNSLGSPSLEHADAVHYLWGSVAEFTKQIVAQIEGHREPRSRPLVRAER